MQGCHYWQNKVIKKAKINLSSLTIAYFTRQKNKNIDFLLFKENLLTNNFHFLNQFFPQYVGNTIILYFIVSFMI